MFASVSMHVFLTLRFFIPMKGPFCGGDAHSEIATMAERIWDVAGPTVLQLLEENPQYELVLTGHSLGAGTASLLNILIHHDKQELIGKRTVHCFAFAAPPIFAPLHAAPDAIRACTNYIHERDVVPFLSVDAVRHLCACIQAVEDLELSWRQRMELITWYKDPSKELLDAVRLANENRLDPKPGAPLLAIPAAANVWMRENKETGRYDFKICESQALATLGIFLNSKMFEDHFPSRYEHAFHNLDD
jgi:Lipase (class 3)